MPKVSVIMPSLNVMKYIRQCIEGVLNQTLTDIEIICVDAGSTDGTLEFLREMEEKDSRVRVILSEYKSYGYQVNLGVSSALGEYIGIVETDDYIEYDMYEKLYNKAMKTEVDYVKAQGEYIQEILKGELIKSPIINFDAIKQDEVINPSLHPELEFWDRYIWLGLYKKDFIKSIRLNESPGAAYQDISFSLFLHSKATKAVYINEMVYHYRIDNTAASSDSPRAFKYLMDERKYMEETLCDLPIEWKKFYLLKTFDQMLTRYYIASYGEIFFAAKDQHVFELHSMFVDAFEKNILSEADFSEERYALFRLFLESPYALYGAISKDVKVRKMQMKRFKAKLDGQKIVLFGTGLRARYIYALLTRNKIGELIVACDNSEEKIGQKYYELDIISPANAAVKYPEAYYLISSSKYGKEMSEELENLGIDFGKIVIYNLGEDFKLLETI